MKKSNDNFIDIFVNLFRKFELFKPLIGIYDKYREGILYLFFGVLTTLVNILAYTVLSKLIQVDYMVSNVIAWVLSVIFAYVTNKIYVFDSKTKGFKELITQISTFFMARALSLILDMGIMYIGINIFKFNDIVVKIVSNIIVIIANYIISKLWIFKDSKGKKQLNYLNNFVDIVKYSGVFILIFASITLIFTNLLFIVNITINKFHLPIIFLITIILFYIIYRKNNIKINTISMLLGLFVFIIATYISGNIYDVTADGNTYHKLAIGAMKNGWNPVYTDSLDFDKDQGNPFNVSEDNVNVKWVDHYAKGTETYGAVIYAFTGNIESGKSYTLLLMYAAFAIVTAYLFKNRKFNLFLSAILAFLLFINPITVVQMFNYYVDGVLMITLLLIIYECLIISTKNLENRKESFLILGMAIIWCINAKFTGLAFAGIFCLAFYIYWLIIDYKRYGKKVFKERLLKYSIFYFVVVIVSLCLVGASSYLRNTVQHGNPLYPLYGKGHVPNMVVQEQPKSFAQKNNLEIFFISLFSKGVNVSPSYSDANVQPELKIPFTFSKEEIQNYSIPDIRMAGFGPLFSGVFLVTLICSIIISINLIRNKKWNILIPYLIVFIISFGLVIGVYGSYWARYIPYVFMLPMLLLVYLFYITENDKFRKLKFFIGTFLTIVLLINVLLVIKVQCDSALVNTRYVKERLANFSEYSRENESVEIILNHSGVQAALYNLDDMGITNYKVVDGTLEDKNDGFFFKY